MRRLQITHLISKYYMENYPSIYTDDDSFSCNYITEEKKQQKQEKPNISFFSEFQGQILITDNAQ